MRQGLSKNLLTTIFFSPEKKKSTTIDYGENMIDTNTENSRHNKNSRNMGKKCNRLHSLCMPDSHQQKTEVVQGSQFFFGSANI